MIDFVTLKFSVKNFPYNDASSYLSSLTWATKDFYYYDVTTGKISNESFPNDGKLNVSVGISNLEVSMTDVKCFEMIAKLL